MESMIFRYAASCLLFIAQRDIVCGYESYKYLNPYENIHAQPKAPYEW